MEKKIQNLLNDLSKTKRLEYELLQEVEQRGLKPHDLFLSEREIIERFRLGRNTVRQAVTNLVDSGRLYKINGKGTFVAPSTKLAQILVVSRYGINSLKNGNYAEMSFLSGVTATLNQAKMPCVAISVHSNEFLKIYQDIEYVYKNLAGIIFHAEPHALHETYEILKSKRIPVMFYGSSKNVEGLPGINYFVYDQEQVVHTALDYLYEKGHRKIGCFSSSTSEVRNQRADIFEEWMRQKNLPCDVMLKVEHQSPISRENRYKVITGFMQAHPIPKSCTAMFITDDLLARYFINVAYRLGYRIPDDFAVISISNYPFCIDFITPLTSVEIPFFADGEQCAQLFLQLIEGDIEEIHAYSKIRLVVRESA